MYCPYNKTLKTTWLWVIIYKIKGVWYYSKDCVHVQGSKLFLVLSRILCLILLVCRATGHDRFISIEDGGWDEVIIKGNVSVEVLQSRNKLDLPPKLGAVCVCARVCVCVCVCVCVRVCGVVCVCVTTSLT